MLSHAMVNVNSALQSAQNAEPTKMNGGLASSNPGRTKKIKALSTLIAGAATRRRKLWRSQLPGKSRLSLDL
jgi:hypothetical protein